VVRARQRQGGRETHNKAQLPLRSSSTKEKEKKKSPAANRQPRAGVCSCLKACLFGSRLKQEIAKANAGAARVTGARGCFACVYSQPPRAPTALIPNGQV
jgi:hypothetical protein